MGEIADMMIDGEVCEECGEFFDDEAPGYPRKCSACRKTDVQIRRQNFIQSIKMTCPECKKTVKTSGIRQHYEAKHHNVKVPDVV